MGCDYTVGERHVQGGKHDVDDWFNTSHQQVNSMMA
jgi:hypothetical protein